LQCFLWMDIGTTSLREQTDDVVSKPSAARGKPETSSESQKW
jgi:hypothetical protein